jgi:hypothetical protein
MSTLFVSHSSKDNSAAKHICAKLFAEGHQSIFLDFDPDIGIQAGVSWERTLYTKLRSCRAVIALHRFAVVFCRNCPGPNGRQAGVRSAD